MDTIIEYIQTGLDTAIRFAPRLVIAIVLLFVGWKGSGLIAGWLRKLLEKREVDATLIPFLATVTSTLIKAAVVISVISYIGIPAASFVAVIGAAGLAVGMALSGTLQNFAGGVMILLLRPFKTGDVVETQGFTGKVREIQIFHTVLMTPDNKTIILPNGPVSNDTIVNYTREKTRRVDMTFGIGYSDDIDKARGILEGLIQDDKRILKDPEHLVVIGELADSSVNFTVRVWAATSDYWDVFFDMHEAVKKAFDSAGISIPFPQTDVHVHQS